VTDELIYTDRFENNKYVYALRHYKLPVIFFQMFIIYYIAVKQGVAKFKYRPFTN
jgi:hypothetical protein